ncbi:MULTISPECIES: 16S rRNA (cytosine(967)-C(5))-methyltransferase RsmB [environmental samples]|uniref:16S rRNA (cytosine(967)-C(5))-methyltransferase RsmB n=1 Tax=environmental samples TaxID=876090 RepID=UPI00034052D8|nr:MULTISPECIES: 16S rRNA (cytosine(967)-C(5))-methyltransferase RsmB [environmental samples]CDC74080.1 rRNA methyltransferase [Oscillibacter sp. CAG:155]
MSHSARDTALGVLVACRTHGAWADAALKAQLARDRLSPQDAALCSRMVYGVTQNRLLLDFYLAAYCSQKPDHLQPPLLDILRLGAYQILFLDKVPDRAAVSEAVELAKRSGRGQAAGLVNAVLRKLSQNKNALPPIPDRDEAKFLSIRYSHPKWLVKRLLELLGREEAEAFLSADNTAAPLTVQVNPLKTTPEALTAELEALGVRVTPHAWVPGCLELSGTGDLTALEPFRAGHFLVQDGAAALAARAAAVMPGQRVLDVCAAPGGKSFGAAFAMEDRGEILACDLHENKLKRIREGAQRLGLTCIRTAAADGREFRSEWEAAFDTVLVDAPCSGLGIIRKKPDIRYKKADDLFTLPVVQQAILDNACRYVKPGGVLVYSTCTILPEENQQITDAFLAQHPDFSREDLSLPAQAGQTDGQVTLWPHRHDTDGFYICRMRRQASGGKLL